MYVLFQRIKVSNVLNVQTFLALVKERVNCLAMFGNGMWLGSVIPSLSILLILALMKSLSIYFLFFYPKQGENNTSMQGITWNENEGEY